MNAGLRAVLDGPDFAFMEAYTAWVRAGQQPAVAAVLAHESATGTGSAGGEFDRPTRRTEPGAGRPSVMAPGAQWD